MEMTSQRPEDGQLIRASKRRKLDEYCESEQDSSWGRTSTQLSHRDYTVGWICALPVEFAAARAMLDQVHPELPNIGNDDNSYILGQICNHNIVITCLPSGVYGTTSAVTVASMMVSSFSKVRVALVVGVGGGVPSRGSHIGLGDVVVSIRGSNYGGVDQYDFGKSLQHGILKRTGTFNKPPETSTATTIPSSQLPGAKNLSLTGDLDLQDAILRYNTSLLIHRIQAAHSELGLHQQGVLPEQTDNRSLSVSTNNNDQFLPALLSQLERSIYHQQGFPATSTASHFHGSSPSSLRSEADPTHPRHRGDFRIALLCALPLEADAVKAIFDKRWDDDGDIFGKAPRDHNAYSTGKVGRHNVVLAHMPAIGKEAAASVAANLRSSFQGVQLAIVVGVCGAMPTSPTGDEIFLGDVVISEGIIPHDFGRRYPDHFARKDSILDSLGRPNAEIRAVLAKLKSRWDHKNLEAKVNRYMSTLQPILGETSLYPGARQDKLFLPSYRHKHQRPSGCELCEACSHKTDPVCDKALGLTCEQLNCGDEESVLRVRPNESGANGAANELTSYQPKVHFGLVASGDVVMKSGEHRDQIAGKEKVIAFEMEGAGVWDTLPCLIIKGVCDYADSHKSKRWQDYAAASAAACMKAFLESWATSDNPIVM